MGGDILLLLKYTLEKKLKKFFVKNLYKFYEY